MLNFSVCVLPHLDHHVHGPLWHDRHKAGHRLQLGEGHLGVLLHDGDSLLKKGFGSRPVKVDIMLQQLS